MSSASPKFFFKSCRTCSDSANTTWRRSLICRKEFHEFGGEYPVVNAELAERAHPRLKSVGRHPLAELRERGIVATERAPQGFARADADVAAVIDHRAGEKQFA